MPRTTTNARRTHNISPKARRNHSRNRRRSAKDAHPHHNSLRPRQPQPRCSPDPQRASPAGPAHRTRPPRLPPGTHARTVPTGGARATEVPRFLSPSRPRTRAWGNKAPAASGNGALRASASSPALPRPHRTGRMPRGTPRGQAQIDSGGRK